MDREAFAEKLRAALTDVPFPIELASPIPEALPTPVQVDVRRAPVYRWEFDVQRDAEGRIMKMVAAPVAQLEWGLTMEAGDQ